MERVFGKLLDELDLVGRKGFAQFGSNGLDYKGALQPFEVTDPDTGEINRFRVVYVWSSEAAKSVSDGRERALVNAEEALARVQRGLGGRYYKTKEDVDKRVAQILPPVEGLITVTTGTRKGRPTFRLDATTEPSRRRLRPTGSMRSPLTSQGGCRRPRCSRSTRIRHWWSSVTAISSRRSRCAPCSCTTTIASTLLSASSVSPCLCSGSSRPMSERRSVPMWSCQACSPKGAPRVPRGATFMPHSRVSGSHTSATASSLPNTHSEPAAPAARRCRLMAGRRAD